MSIRLKCAALTVVGLSSHTETTAGPPAVHDQQQTRPVMASWLSSNKRSPKEEARYKREVDDLKFYKIFKLAPATSWYVVTILIKEYEVLKLAIKLLLKIIVHFILCIIKTQQWNFSNYLIL